MKKSPTLILAVAAALLSLAFQTPPAGWLKFTSEEGRFSVLMPGPDAPKDMAETRTDPKVGSYTVHLFAKKAEKGFFMAGWVDYAPSFNFGVQAELAANRDNFIKSAKANLLGTTRIRLGAHPGIEFKAEIPGRADIVSRVYIVGRRPYQLITVAPAGRDASANRARFFSSFRVAASR